jgi:hypothetical protein
MYPRIKPTKTVYPCRYRSQTIATTADGHNKVWMTWEAVEREHFNPHGSLVADFSKPIEVDASRVKNHCYEPESPVAETVS